MGYFSGLEVLQALIAAIHSNDARVMTGFVVNSTCNSAHSTVFGLLS